MRRWLVIGFVLAGLSLASFQAASTASDESPRLQATATLRTTPEGPEVLVPDQVNVRLGPATDYELVGVLISGQRVPALGRSPGGEWIQIFYPGVEGNVAWVYAPLVRLEGQALLPVVEPPPTPTPRVTATIDPTLAAQFNLLDVTPTRLPTFTPADPVVQPTFSPQGEPVSGRRFPPALAILAMLIVGLFGMVISVLRGGS